MFKNIAIYGGAFDPPHISHIKLINYLQNLNFIDQVWLLPCGDRTDKQLLLSKNARFSLMEKIFRNNPNIKVVNYEIQMNKRLGRMVHTYELLKQLREIFNCYKFHFVIGGDILESLETWGNGKQLKQQTDFIIFNRKGYEINETSLPPKHYKCIDQLEQISSSYLKKILLDQQKQNQEKISQIQKYVPPQVLDCLKEEKIL